MKDKKRIIIILGLFLIISFSGCTENGDSSYNTEVDDSKYVFIEIYDGFSIKNPNVGNFDIYKSDYSRYDDDLYIEIKNFHETTADNKYVSVEVTDYDFYQPTKYVIKVSGNIEFEGDQTIESISSIYLDMTVRDSTGKLIGDDKIDLEIENHQSIPFTTQVIIRSD